MTPQLLKRFPVLRPPVSSPVILPRTRADYPALAADFEVIDRELASAFSNCDGTALRSQHRYRRQQILILLGSALVVGLGGLQAALPDQRWPGLVLAVLGIALATSSRFAKDQGWLDDYLSSRVRAERLRSHCFRYLSRTGRYANADRDLVLRRAVLAIEHGKEPR
jgi:hypothetical protein